MSTINQDYNAFPEDPAPLPIYFRCIFCKRLIRTRHGKGSDYMPDECEICQANHSWSPLWD